MSNKFARYVRAKAGRKRRLSTALLVVAMLASVLGVTTAPAGAQTPACTSSDSDSDGDGFGWENNQTCIVGASTPAPAATGAECVDSDGDGFGWDGTATCIVGASRPAPTPAPAPAPAPSGAECVDSDGDGFGWDGTATCIVDSGSEQEPPDVPRERVVISLGDSYISGEAGDLIGNNSAEIRAGAYVDGTDTPNNRCHRSDVAPINSAQISGVRAINIACSGATSENVLNTGQWGEGSQIGQLRTLAQANDVEMVVVSIGGNDAGFEDLVAACVTGFALDRPCSDPGIAGPFERRVENNLGPGADATVAAVKQVLATTGNSDARIVLQSYPSPVPSFTVYDGPQRLNHGCAFLGDDIRYIDSTFVPLIDETLRGVASAQGVEFLSLSDAFVGKELCSRTVTSRGNSSNPADLEWAAGVRLGSNGPLQQSVHPNALGQQALGRCIGLLWQSNNTQHTCYNTFVGGPADMVLVGPGQERSFNRSRPPQAGPCSSVAFDPDGDGWGYENRLACTATPIGAGDVNCEIGASGDEARICELILDRINEELDEANLSLDRDGLLLTYEDTEDIRISDSSCSNRVEVTNQLLTARIGSDTELDLSADSLMEPLGVGLTVPFELDARIDAKTELGARIPFVGCVEYASDRYNATGSADGTAEIAIALDLNVDTRPTADGNLLVILDPQVEVVTALGDFELDLDISGQNPLVQAGAFIAGISSGLTEVLFTGNPNGLFDTLIPFGLTAELLTPQFVDDILIDAAERAAFEEANNLLINLEQDLEAQLGEALNLENGQRTFEVSGDFARLLENGASFDDLLEVVG